MADDAAPLTHWTDSVLGELVWDDRNATWAGQVAFNGRPIRIDIDPGVRDPLPAEQTAAIASAVALLPGLRAAEPGLRRQAAAEIAAAVAEQQQEIELPVTEFADTLELQSISMCEGAGLHYHSGHFPGQTITIFVEADASFGDAEVYETRYRA